MPWFRLSQFDGDRGAVGDLPPQTIPPNIFTDARNVRFTDGAVEKAPGMGAVYGAPAITPYYLLSSQDNSGVKRLFVAGQTAIYFYLSGSYSDATRAVGGSYNAGVNNVWTGGVLHGVPFLNNGTDKPQSFDGGTGKFVDLPNWPAGYSAKAFRAFKNYLVALNWNNGSTQFPHNVLWSHPADPGSVPGTGAWDFSDPTKDAGDAPLSDTPGHIIDGLAMGDSFVVYKEDATYLMQHVGAPFIFNFRPVLRESGILSRNCMGEVMGRHVVLTTDDVIMFDGNGAESIINRKWRRTLFANVSVADYEKSFVAILPDRREAWFCISSTMGYAPDIAYVWDWRANTWSKRDLPFSQSIALAFAPDAAGDSWNTDADTWDSDGEGWSAFALRGKAAVVSSVTDVNIYTLNVGETIAGTPMTASVQHDSYDFASDKDVESADLIKHISKIRPRIVANAGVQLTFEIGTQMHINDPITWGAPQTFTVGTDDELCLGVNGRYISWRVSSTCDCTWRLEAIDFLIAGGGRF